MFASRWYRQLTQPRILTVTITTLVGILVGALVTLTQPPQFRAQLEVVISPSTTRSVADYNTASTLAQTQTPTYGSLASSPETLSEVISRLHLRMTQDELKSMLNVDTSSTAPVLTLQVTGREQTLVAPIANTLANELILIVKERTRAPGGSSFLSASATSVAAVPSRPYGPNWILNILIGAVIGVLCGLFANNLRGKLDFPARRYVENA